MILRRKLFCVSLRSCRRREGSGSRNAWGRSLTPFVIMCYRNSTVPTDRGTRLDDDAPEPMDQVIDLEGFLVTKQTRERVEKKVLGQLGKGSPAASLYLSGRKGERRSLREFGVDRDYLRVLLHRAKQSFRVSYEKSQATGLPQPKQ